MHVQGRSQNQRILAWLKSGRTITPLQALRKFGCFRLGARIHNLKEEGYLIKSRLVSERGKRFARYLLVN